jgi:hypothetical protein
VVPPGAAQAREVLLRSPEAEEILAEIIVLRKIVINLLYAQSGRTRSFTYRTTGWLKSATNPESGTSSTPTRPQGGC